MNGFREELARVVTDGDTSTGVGVSSREPVDRSEDRGSVIVPNVLVLVCGSAREPTKGDRDCDRPCAWCMLVPSHHIPEPLYPPLPYLKPRKPSS